MSDANGTKTTLSYIASYKDCRRFHFLSILSVSKSTTSAYAIKEAPVLTPKQALNQLVLYTQKRREGKVPLRVLMNAVIFYEGLAFAGICIFTLLCAKSAGVNISKNLMADALMIFGLCNVAFSFVLQNVSDRRAKGEGQ